MQQAFEKTFVSTFKTLLLFEIITTIVTLQQNFPLINKEF